MQKGKSTLTFCPAPGGSISRATDVKHTFSSLGRGKSAFCGPSHTQVLMIVLLKEVFVCPAVENRMSKGENAKIGFPNVLLQLVLPSLNAYSGLGSI